MAAPQETQPGRFRPKGPLAPSTNPALSIISSGTDTAAIESITFPQSQEGIASRRERVKGEGSRTKRILAGTAAAALIAGGIGFGINEVNKGIAATEELTPKPQPQDQIETLPTGSPTQQIKINETTRTIVIPETKEPLTPRIRTSQSTNEDSTPTPFETRAAVAPEVVNSQTSRFMPKLPDEAERLIREAEIKEGRFKITVPDSLRTEKLSMRVIKMRGPSRLRPETMLGIIADEKIPSYQLESLVSGTVLEANAKKGANIGGITILNESGKAITYLLPPSNAILRVKKGDRVEIGQKIVSIDNYDPLSTDNEPFKNFLLSDTQDAPRNTIVLVAGTIDGNSKSFKNQNLNVGSLLQNTSGGFITITPAPASSTK